MNSLCIIPARGGSKRIPHKNIKNFLGKPIISYSIKKALDSNLFDEVMVSTDNEQIAQFSEKLGALVPFKRSNKNADDFATTIDVILEVVEEYKKIGKSFNYICCIYPTAPFITKEKLNESFNILKNRNLDSVFPIIKYSFPIQRAMQISHSNHIKMIYPENISARSQDLTPSYHDAGQFYWLSTHKILSQKKLWTDNTGFIEINELEAQDIDTEIDWKLAELKYKLMLNEKKENSF